MSSETAVHGQKTPKRGLALIAAMSVLSFPAAAFAWGYEGHEVVAAIARGYLTPQVRARVDQMLAADPDTLTPHDMMDEATWADSYRNSHRETGGWHFVDIELDHPDMRAACFGFPASGPIASQGPAQDCIVDKLAEFSQELANPATSPAERLLALKFVLHFVGDIHQPLHDSDNHDKGGNCVLLSLGGPRQVNLHSYWDTVVVRDLGEDPQTVATTLAGRITLEEKAAWEKGDSKSWAQEGFDIAQSKVYTLGSKPGCAPDSSPVSLPPGYEEAARDIVTLQLQKAGVRLAAVLNHSLGS
ncbi:MAG TPA: S1/P1 nuclease [Steroidobacteraceae bacterium]|nr:S1/P1 nuclease [Steroidobacteraceae bacterium]